MRTGNPRAKGGWRRGLQGTTLLELLVAVCILGIAVGPMLLFMEYSTTNSVRLRDQSVATYVAKMEMEKLINQPETAIEAVMDIGSYDVDGYKVTVTWGRKVDADGNLLEVDAFGEVYAPDPDRPPDEPGYYVYKEYPELSEITVEVRNKDGILLNEYTDVIFTGVAP